ncbi:MAG TPA: single-stranded-DNA-specific exonuclease RecJ [Campylobacterales bacterium]|nr:single-stranded-DNA-specific exonuclease RecJ [Campylobacterales bacterium]
MESRLKKEDIEEILSKRFADDTCNSLASIPHPTELKDVEKAAKRVKIAIENNEKIAVVGDYDADGVVSSVIMMEFFDDIGANVVLKIPNRFEDGYGISPKIIENLDADLIITVDNGISAVEAANLCKEKGVDLIITDHHMVPDTLPEAYAIINPKQHDCTFPTSEICGAQVAWYFIAAIKDELGIDYNLSKFLDILAIAIVADMMELKGMNRTMVKNGLKKINKIERPFFKAVQNFYRKSSFKSDDISFLLAPVINSSGRLEDATLSYELIRSKTELEAMQNLEYISGLNNQRKEIEHELFEQAVLSVDESQSIIVSWGEGWHEGVIGIVASRLSRRYKKPAIVFSITEGKAKGSARSVGAINILEHISHQKEYLFGYGGHKGAAGMSLDANSLEAFKKAIESELAEVDEEDFVERSEVVGEINPSAIGFELLNILELYEPYGQKNPKPHFLLKNAYVKTGKVIGMNQNHQKLTLLSDEMTLESIEFNFDKEIKSGDHIDLICSVSKNEFRGVVSAQIMIKQVL